MAKQANQVATRQQTAVADAKSGSQKAILARFMGDLDRRMPIVRHLLPSHVSETEFRAMMITALSNSKDGKLFDCTPASLLRACTEAATDGLSLSPQHKQADIIPRWNKKLNEGKGGLEATYQPRYGGLMALARRSGEIKKIFAHVVREKDEFSYELGLNKTIHKHIPALGGMSALVQAYCVWELKDGTVDFEVLEQRDIDRAKRASQSRNREGELFGPWADDEAEMWRKTAVRRATKYMPSSTEDMQRFKAAVEREMANDVGESTMDVAAFDLPDDPAPTAASGNSQLDRIEGKVGAQQQAPQEKPKDDPAPAGAQQAAGAQPPAGENAAAGITIPLVKNGGQVDFKAWTALAEAAFATLTNADARRAWTQRHATLLEGLEISAPDIGDELLTKTQEFRR